MTYLYEYNMNINNNKLIEKTVKNMKLIIPDIDEKINNLNKKIDLITTEKEKGMKETNTWFLECQLELDSFCRELEVVRNILK